MANKKKDQMILEIEKDLQDGDTLRKAGEESEDKIKKDIDNLKDYDVILSTWGVGNHGGGPSRKDLKDIEHKSASIKVIPP